MLYVVYPYSVCTHWTMSENLAIPFVLLTIYQCSFLLREQPTHKQGIYAGLSVAALTLTRIQSISISAPLMGWILFRTWRKKRNWIPLLSALSISGLTILLVWSFTGYLSSTESSPIYSNIPLKDSIPTPQLLGLFIARFLFHWMALWLEGGLLIPSLLVFTLFYILKNKHSFSYFQREIIYLIFFTALCNVAIISWIISFSWKINRPDQPWTVFLRYFCYANIISLPAAVLAMGRVSSSSFSQRWRYMSLYVGISLLGFLGPHMPYAWESLKRLPYYFTNAPSLDYVLQFHGEGVWVGSFIMLAGAMFVGVFALWNRCAGIVITFLFFTYILGCGIDYQLEQKHTANERWGYSDIHNFCAQLQKGRWKEIPLYCHDVSSSRYLRANLQYWLFKNTNFLGPEDPEPQRPYLLLTFEELDEGKQVFLSGKLRAYLFEKKKEPVSD